MFDRSIDRCPFTVWSLHHCFGGGHPLVSGWVVNFFFFWESTSTMLLHCIVLFFFVWFVRIYTFCCWIVRWSVQNAFLSLLLLFWWWSHIQRRLDSVWCVLTSSNRVAVLLPLCLLSCLIGFSEKTFEGETRLNVLSRLKRLYISP
jgi:hypothetical protein